MAERVKLIDILKIQKEDESKTSKKDWSPIEICEGMSYIYSKSLLVLHKLKYFDKKHGHLKGNTLLLKQQGQT